MTQYIYKTELSSINIFRLSKALCTTLLRTVLEWLRQLLGTRSLPPILLLLLPATWAEIFEHFLDDQHSGQGASSYSSIMQNRTQTQSNRKTQGLQYVDGHNKMKTESDGDTEDAQRRIYKYL